MTMTAPLVGLLIALLGEVPTTVDVDALLAAKKCTFCHTVASAGIASSRPEGVKGAIVDLSGVGARRPRPWLEAYLLKKEKIEQREHPATFRGTPEELAALVDWMLALREPAPKK